MVSPVRLVQHLSFHYDEDDVDFILTFKFDIPQVFRKVVKCYF